MSTSSNKIIDSINDAIKTDYSQQNRILSFDEYLDIVRKDPRCHTRSSAQYMLDMMDSFGKTGERFKLFDQEFVDPRFKVIGQESVQNQIYNILLSFINEGINNKLILLHGPNGSAKSTLISCLVRGLEEYSHNTAGAMYRFHWIFPADTVVKSNLGLGSTGKTEDSALTSYAKLADTEIAARISCDLKDHPLFLLPLKQRQGLLRELNENKHKASEYLFKGDLSQKSKIIFEALLRSYKGDYRKVLRHVQIERFFISKRYREGAVTIEPQMHVDAEARQITMDKSVSMLPSSLSSLSLFDLGGDLVHGNRGIVEYNDLLKRPIDAFKYLLTTTESGTVSIGGTNAFIDTVLIGTCNEAQLDAFKEYPDFPSFKARMELVRAPYLLEYSREADIYATQTKHWAGDHHVAPHTLEMAGLWAVLCRLKKPNASHYASSISYIIHSLSPLEKARLYDSGTVPARLTSEERKILKATIEEIRREYTAVPNYEGRIGPSPREMKIILFNAQERNKKGILSPLELFAELEDFVKRTTEYDYLREDIVEGYHDCRGFINVIREVYLESLDNEVRGSLGVHDDAQYEAFLRKYITHLSHHLKKEKIKNPTTGANENPDQFLMEEFEKVVGIMEDKNLFRQNIMTQLGVFALENPSGAGQLMDYAKVFPDLMKKIGNHYLDAHKGLMKKVYDSLTLFEAYKRGQGQDASAKPKTVEQIEGEKLAQKLLENMKNRFGYNEVSTIEAFVYLYQKRY